MTGLTTRIALSLTLVEAPFGDGIADDEGNPPPEGQVRGGDGSSRQFLAQGSEESWVRRERAPSFEDALTLFSLSMGAIALYLAK